MGAPRQPRNTSGVPESRDRRGAAQYGEPVLLSADTDALRSLILRAAGAASTLDDLDPDVGSLVVGALGDAGPADGRVLELLSDPDPIVRTGAVLLLDRLGSEVNAARLAEAMVMAWRGLIDQPPVGFDDAWARTLWGHGLLVLAERVSDRDEPTTDLLTEWADHVELRGPLLVRLARSVPDLVCREARRWTNAEDSGVVVALPDHARRTRYVAALAPWPVRTIPAVVEGLVAVGVSAAEIDELVVEMLGRRP